jgi:DNA-binding transcriptional MocR family regulator
MDGHRRLLVPKFAAVDDALRQGLGDSGAARWTKPDGGYFITVDAMDGTAQRVVELAKQAGMAGRPASPHGLTRPNCAWPTSPRSTGQGASGARVRISWPGSAPPGGDQGEEKVPSPPPSSGGASGSAWYSG